MRLTLANPRLSHTFMSERVCSSVDESDAYIDYNFKKPSRLLSAKSVGLKRPSTQSDSQKPQNHSGVNQLSRMRTLLKQNLSEAKLQTQPQIINLKTLEK